MLICIQNSFPSTFQGLKKSNSATNSCWLMHGACAFGHWMTSLGTWGLINGHNTYNGLFSEVMEEIGKLERSLIGLIHCDIKMEKLVTIQILQECGCSWGGVDILGHSLELHWLLFIINSCNVSGHWRVTTVNRSDSFVGEIGELWQCFFSLIVHKQSHGKTTLGVQTMWNSWTRS